MKCHTCKYIKQRGPQSKTKKKITENLDLTARLIGWLICGKVPRTVCLSTGRTETSTSTGRKRGAGVGNVVQRLGRTPCRCRGRWRASRRPPHRSRYSTLLWPGSGPEHTAAAAAATAATTAISSAARIPWRHQQQRDRATGATAPQPASQWVPLELVTAQYTPSSKIEMCPETRCGVLTEMCSFVDNYCLFLQGNLKMMATGYMYLPNYMA